MLLTIPDSGALRRLHELKQSLTTLRRLLWPQREMLYALLRDEYPLIKDNNKIYYRDCYDHTIQIMDLIETYRDTVTGLLDIYLSSISYHLNEIMRALTVIVTIFIPLTFIVGVQGMNFRNDKSPWAIPKLAAYYGYPLVWLVMIALAIGTLIHFKRKNWF